MSNKTTIKDVAKASKVSISTVSSVLNKKNNISEKTIQRVNFFVKKLNYSPNPLAVNLLKNKTMNIGVIIPDILNPYFAEIFKEINIQAQKSNYSAFLIEFNKKDDSEQWWEHINRIAVDGYISLSNITNDMIWKFKKPIICVDQLIDSHFTTIEFDNQAAIKTLVDYVVEKGHTDIAFFGANETFVGRQRMGGFKKAIQKHQNIKHFIFDGDFSFNTGLENMKTLIHSVNYRKVSAIICANDLIAIGAIYQCSLNNLKVPQNYSITGLDGIKQAQLFIPTLTTIRQPIEKFAQLAFEILLNYIDNKKNDKIKNNVMILKGAFIEGQSVAKKQNKN